MNILQLCNKLPYPPKDGGSIATLNLSKGFAKSGNNVCILAINTNKHFTALNTIPKDIQDKITFKAVEVNTDIKISKALNNLLFSTKAYNATRFLDSEFERELISMLKSESFDVIQLEGLYMAQYINVIRKHSNAIIALRSHNIEHEIWHRSARQTRSLLKKYYLNNLASRIKKLKICLLNKYDVLIPITQRDADIYKKLGNNKPVFVSQTGINYSELKQADINVEYPSLFHMGALDWPPNQEGITWFIKYVWPGIIGKFPDLKFYIAGRNAPAWLIKSLNHKNIIYLGEVENAYKFMQEKAIMVVPLLSGSGMRIKIIEGMALGKTIISTSIGSEGINCQEGKEIIIANSKEEFILKLEKLISNKKIFVEIGKNAVKFVLENFDNNKISDSLMNFYKSQIIR